MRGIAPAPRRFVLSAVLVTLAVRIELLGPDEIREEWIGWKDGKLVTPATKFHLKRKTS